MRFFICLILHILCVYIPTYSQALSYTDPAQAYNKLVLEKNNGTFFRIGSYKVTGTPYLYGGKNQGDIYTKGYFSKGKVFSYNVYSKTLEIYTDDGVSPIIKDGEAIDSFRYYRKQNDIDLGADLLFVNSSLIQGKDKTFLQLIVKGSKYNVYKKYIGKLSIVSTNYIDATLRQFDIDYEYFYTDSTRDGLRKLKVSPSGLKKEFPNSIGCVAEMQEYSLFTDLDKYLIQFFEKLEKCVK